MTEIRAINPPNHPVRHIESASHRPAAPPAQSQGITGRDIMRILRKRKWIIILPTVFFAILSVVATVLLLQYSPEYTAEALVGVRPLGGGPLDQLVRREYPTDIIERHVMSQVVLVKRHSVLNKVLERKDIRETDWFGRDIDGAVERLYDAISASPMPGTNMIRIEVTMDNREQSPVFANAVARAFVEETSRMVVNLNSEQIKSLSAQLTELDKKLLGIRNQKDQIRGSVNLGDLSERGGIAQMMLELIQKELMRLSSERGIAQAVLATLQAQKDNETLKDSPQVKGILQMDPQLNSLRQSEVSLSIRRDHLIRKFGPQHRDVMNIETQLASIRERIIKMEDKRLGEQSDIVLGLAQSGFDALIAQETAVREEYNQALARVIDANEKFVRIRQLEAHEKATLDEIVRVEKSLNTVRLASGNEQPVSLRSSAETPQDPSWPRWGVMVPAGVMLGLMLGLGLAMLLEFTDTSIKSAADIAQRTNLPILGMVPHSDDLDDEVPDIRRAVLDNSNPLIVEAFRQIRTCLQFSAAKELRRSVLVTSPLPGDGRTGVTLGLAASIARDGRKVLVIDTNFRQPVISRMFAGDGESSQGLSHVLVGQAEWKGLVQEVEPNLYVLSAGLLPPNPAELLGSDAMRNAMEEMVSAYDQVLLDGPPCLVISDAAILSKVVDGTVLVVRAGSNTHGIVLRAKATLSRLKARILGTVLNGVRITTGGYLRKNYETFYEYQAQGDLLPANKS